MCPNYNQLLSTYRFPAHDHALVGAAMRHVVESRVGHTEDVRCLVAAEAFEGVGALPSAQRGRGDISNRIINIMSINEGRERGIQSVREVEERECVCVCVW